MDTLVTMSAPTLSQCMAQSPQQQPQPQGPRHQTISVCSPTTTTGSVTRVVTSHATPHKEATAGATVFVAGSVPDIPSSRVPEVQSAAVIAAAPAGNHVVKIKINPDSRTDAQPRLYSAVRINLDDDYDSSSSDNNNKSVIVYTNGSEDGSLHRAKVISVTENEPCVRISVRSDYSGSESSSEELHPKDSEMVQQRNVPSESSNVSRASSSCFYYSSPLSAMVMSSGQCSPSETLDSGTCSDLDGTPPPLPKKKSSPPVVVGATIQERNHDRTGSLTSSGAEVDSDDNESSISCDSLNSGDLPASANPPAKFRTPRSIKLRSAAKHRKEEPEEDEEEEDEDRVASPSVSKDSSTPRIRSPAPLINECTYEERRREQDAASPAATPAAGNGSKYLYEDDRYYKFHVNEHEEVGDAVAKKNANNNNNNNGEDDESFAGYKILEREAIRSAKGTVRGVKNRVRAGIATFLQKPSTKVSAAQLFLLSSSFFFFSSAPA